MILKITRNFLLTAWILEPSLVSCHCRVHYKKVHVIIHVSLLNRAEVVVNLQFVVEFLLIFWSFLHFFVSSFY